MNGSTFSGNTILVEESGVTTSVGGRRRGGRGGRGSSGGGRGSGFDPSGSGFGGARAGVLLEEVVLNFEGSSNASGSVDYFGDW